MSENKPRDRVVELAATIRLAKINRKRLSSMSGVSYNTIRSLDDGANVTVKTFELIEAAILKQTPDDDKSCKNCQQFDGIDDGEHRFDFCDLRNSIFGSMAPLNSHAPCIAWRAKK